MTFHQVRTAMMENLDCLAHEYQRYSDDKVKQSIAREFGGVSKAFNGLLRELFGDIAFGLKFERDIVVYIEQRNEEGWEKVG